MRVRVLALAAGLAATTAAGAASAADGDADNGKKLYNSTGQCKICHSVEPNQKRVGPSLFGILGRQCGTAAKQVFSSNYKAACEKTQFVWDETSLDGYLEDPTGWISNITGERKRSPMTRDTKKPQDRADIIAYLKTLK